MKQKLVFLFALLLLTIQGWATPVDSLSIISSGKIGHVNLEDLTQGSFGDVSSLSTGTGSLTDIAGSVNPNPVNSGVLEDGVDIGSILESIVMTIRFSEVDFSENFNEVTVGSSATKRYKVTGHNLSFARDLIRDHTGFKVTIKLVLTDNYIPQGHNAEALFFQSDAFSLSEDEMLPDEIDGREYPITVTYTPKEAGKHIFRFHALFNFYFPDGTPCIPDWLQNVPPILNLGGTFAYEFGTAVDRNIITSEKTLSFSDQIVGKPETRSFHVTGKNLCGPLKVELKDNNDGMFSIDKDRITVEEAENNGADVWVTYHPTSEGIHKAKIIISEEGSSETAKVDLSGNAVESQITIGEPPLFPTLTVGDSKSLPIHVSGTNLKGTLMVDLSPSTGMFHLASNPVITAEEAANEGTDIWVTYNPTSAGIHEAIITIQGGGALEPKYVDLRGTAVNPTPPTVTVDQTPLNFGTVHLGDDPKTKTITVKGTDLTGDLNLSITGASGNMFTALPYRISPGDAAAGRPVVVTYKPTAAGNHTATLLITGGGADTTRISLAGHCLPAPEPSITATPSSWDFGTVGAGTTNTHEFTITGSNLSGRISLVSQMETTGGDFTVSPESLPASGGKVKVTFNPTSAGSYGGVFTFGDGQVSTKITVEGKCATITATPSSWDFGTVAKNSTNPKSITVKGYNLTGDLTLTLTGSAMFTINNKRAITISKDEATSGKTVTVTYKPTAGGNHNGKITISGGNAADKTISLTGKCSDITASPSSWDYGTVGAGTTNTHEFTITGSNLSGRISLVSQMETTGGDFTVSPESLPASGGKVKVTFKPTSAGNYGGVFTFGDGQVSTKITVEGKCATITATPSPCDFGTVAKNTTNTKGITIKGTNLTGDLTLTLTGSAMFTINNKRTITISKSAATSGTTVNVAYEPTARGNHNGTITIKGGGAADKVVSVSGTCAEITTNTTSLVFGGYNDSRTFTVKGYYLTGKLTLTSSNSIFTVTPSSITASQAANGVTVTVKCNAATTIQHATGKITISGGNAKPVNVSLTLDATSPQPYAPMVEPEGGNEGGNEEFMNGGSVELYGNSANFTTDVEDMSMSSKVYAEGQNIIIDCPEEENAIISDIAGHAWNVNLQTGHNVIPVNASGLYIVRIREKTTKLMLK